MRPMVSRCGLVLASGLLAALLATTGWAGEVRVLENFEQARSVLDEPAGEVVTEHATDGRNALKVTSGQAVTSSRFDFSGASKYDWLAFDIFNPQGDVRSVLIVIPDTIGTEGGYWARFNDTIALRPGMNHIKLPINNLFRGERGSQPMKDKGPIVAEDIKRVSIVPDYGRQDRGVFYIDYIRLEKEEGPAEVPGMKKFDFGPPGQTVFPGFVAVTFNTRYSKQQGYGLHHDQWPNAARDDQFPNSLYADYVGIRDDTFSVDLPNDEYTVWCVYDDTGYWGGEFRPFNERSIEAEGKTFCVERYTDEEALARYNHFQDVEPLPGDDIYETYVGYRFRPRTFKVRVSDGQLNLTFRADDTLISKVAALVIYPSRRQSQAEAWLAGLQRRVREEWEGLWVYVPPGNPNAGVKLPSQATGGDYLLFVPPLEARVGFTYTPAPEELKKEITSAAAQGEAEPLLVGIRPLKDLGPVQVTVSDLEAVSGGGKIPADAIDVRVVRNLTRRAGSGRYTIAPAVLLPFETVDLKKDLTREFWLTVHVPDDAPGATYTGRVTFRFADGSREVVPVSLKVYPFDLKDADFTFGFFWVRPNLGGVYGPDSARYWQVQEDLLKMLKEYGLTSFTGSPLPAITGVKNGEAVLDFTTFDRFWSIALKLGFKRDYQSYGRGIGNLNPDTAKKHGISYQQLIRSTFRQLAAHSKAMGVPSLTMSLCDEPRTEAQYQRLYKEFAVWQKAAPEVMAGYLSMRSSQLEDPDDPHRRLFDMLTVPIVNGHDAGVMEYARKRGKRVDIYNQGTSRFSFGLYQWREKLAGVGARWQWIMNIAHGDPYYDLDGREPDPCAVYFRTDGLAPAVRLAVAREGIDDLRYITTAVAEAKRVGSYGGEAGVAARRALARIDQAMSKIAVNQRRGADVDLDEFRRGLAEDIAVMKRADARD